MAHCYWLIFYFCLMPFYAYFLALMSKCQESFCFLQDFHKKVDKMSCFVENVLTTLVLIIRTQRQGTKVKRKGKR